MTDRHAPACFHTTRRNLLRAGAAASLAAAAGLAPSAARAGGKVEALLLSCMDFRLMDDVERFMSGPLSLRNNYDHVVLAGASLGAVTDRYPAWNETFWGHLDVAIQLHGIHRVVVLDHRDCGAYRVILGKDLAGDPAEERKVHAAQAQALRAKILEKHPKLDVDLGLMALDGSVETID